MKVITDGLNRIMNAKMSGRTSCKIPFSNFLLESLDVIKKNGYIDYKLAGKGNQREIIVEFKRLNECRVVSPRFYVKNESIDKYVRRFLPSREIGILIISTNKGLMTHIEAEKNKQGGALIAYCY